MDYRSRWRSDASCQFISGVTACAAGKTECPDKDIWLWTGYTLAELDDSQQALLPYIDVLVDGKFIQEQADPGLEWRGSANQVIHRFTL